MTASTAPHGSPAAGREPAAVPPVESVDRALRLVELLQRGERLSVKAAAEHLGVVPSTAHRLLNALLYRDFARQGPHHLYQAGPALVARHDGPITIGTLREVARPGLELLHERIGETAQLMVLHGGNIRFVDGIESAATLRVGVRIGDQMPAYCSAGGKALLAELSNADLDRLYQHGLPPWPTARIRTLPELKRRLATVRDTGYGTNLEETEQGVNGLGVTVHTSAGRPLAAFTLAIPSVRFRKDDIGGHVSALHAAAADTAARIRDLGASGR